MSCKMRFTGREGLFTAYRAAMGRVIPRHFIDQVIVNEIARVDPLIVALREVIRLGGVGDRAAAYTRLERALVTLGPHLRALMPPGDMSGVINPIYRFRYTGASPYMRGELFHIPFQSLPFVREMRCSVAKLPSLYLGGSTEVCWRELGRPDLAIVSVSHFHARPGTGLRVMNFGHRFPRLAAWVNAEPHNFLGPTTDAAVIAAQVACWPLVAACSVRVPDRTRPERPEYFVPQLVLEWITRTHNFHGIRFFSTHYDEYPDDPKTYMNYVFPARTVRSFGYCSELCNLFELTNPVTWEQAKAAPAAGVPRPRYKTRNVLDLALEADFGRAEDGLLGMPVEGLEIMPNFMHPEMRAAVQAQAHAIWEREHRVHGRDQAHWFQAKDELGLEPGFMV